MTGCHLCTVMHAEADLLAQALSPHTCISLSFSCKVCFGTRKGTAECLHRLNTRLSDLPYFLSTLFSLCWQVRVNKPLKGHTVLAFRIRWGRRRHHSSGCATRRAYALMPSCLRLLPANLATSLPCPRSPNLQAAKRWALSSCRSPMATISVQRRRSKS